MLKYLNKARDVFFKFFRILPVVMQNMSKIQDLFTVDKIEGVVH